LREHKCKLPPARPPKNQIFKCSVCKQNWKVKRSEDGTYRWVIVMKMERP
jgi:hypothetical protein